MKARMTHVLALLTALVLLSMVMPLGAEPLAANTSSVTAAAKYTPSSNRLPVMFLEVADAPDSGTQFQVRGDGGTMWLTEDAIWLTITEDALTDASGPRTTGDLDSPGTEPQVGVNLKLTFPGANPHPHLEPISRLDTQIIYLVGNRPEDRQENVPAWGGVRYVDLYPGVDLEILGQAGRLVKRLLCRSGCNESLGAVQMLVEGADKVALRDNHLQLHTSAGELLLPLLEVAGVEEAQLPAPSLASSTITHPFAASDSTSSNGAAGLIWSTFVGGGNDEFQSEVLLDELENPIVATCTYSTDYPTTTGAFDASLNGNMDIFVFKLSTDGSSLEFGTYIGGSDHEELEDMVQDRNGNLVVTGSTISTDFPTTSGAYDPSPDGIGYNKDDAYILKLAADGTSLLFSTFIGGSGLDGGRGLALDSQDNIVVSGNTLSADFPTTDGAYDRTYAGGGTCWGCGDTFVSKLSADGSDLMWSTFVGGSGAEAGWRVALDIQEDVVVLGWTTSPDFPIAGNAFDPTYNGDADIYILRLSADGDDLLHSTYLGGSGRDDAWLAKLRLDAAGNAVATGYTESTDFPTTSGAYDTSHNGQSDAFVLKLSVDTGELLYSTYLGGSAWDAGRALVLDEAGNVIVSGQTSSSDFPTTGDAYDATYNGDRDAYVAKLAADGRTLQYGTYIGGAGREQGFSLVLDAAGNPILSGNTESPDFPIASETYDATHNGEFDTFVLKLQALNRPPSVGADQALVVVDEGQLALNTGTVSDPDGETVALDASVGAVTNNGDGTWSWSLLTTDGPTESQAVTIYGHDQNGSTSQTTFNLAVNNANPTVDSISVPLEPVSTDGQAGDAISAAFTDPAGVKDKPYRCDFDLDFDGATFSADFSATGIAGSPCTAPLSYDEPGVYQVKVVVTDKDGGQGSLTATQFIVIYDPSAGFVTGGSWIESPPGAYKVNDHDMPGYSWQQGFETDASGWFELGGTIQRVPSGTDGVPSADGQWHAEITVGPSNGEGAYTKFGEYSSVFPPGGFAQLVDVYIDPAMGSSGEGWALDNALNGNDGIWIEAGGVGAIKGSDGKWWLAADGDGAGYPGPASGGAGLGIDTAGWYTIESQWVENAEDPSMIDRNTLIRDSSGTVLYGAYNLKQSSLADAGGNRYGWFLDPSGPDWPPIQFPLPIDNGRLAQIVGPTGKATFGFVSKYKKGADTPSGNTEFVFQAAGLNFHSSSYDWLVVTGSDYAKFKGSGTINGLQAPNDLDYKFMLWAGDGTGDEGADTFRIKIWWEEADEVEHVVYDNGMDQEIGGGNVVVHTKK